MLMMKLQSDCKLLSSIKELYKVCFDVYASFTFVR